MGMRIGKKCVCMTRPQRWRSCCTRIRITRQAAVFWKPDAVVGAQTISLVQYSPEAFFTSVDLSEASVREARKRLDAAGCKNVQFRQGDIFHLPFRPESFDHVFVCFVLEHLPDPETALSVLKQYLKPGGTMTVIEGDHGSAYFYPDSEAARKAIQCQIDLQRKAGGNALIGRELYPLLIKAGFAAVRVSPRLVYVDASKPEYVDGFTKKTFTAMIEGIRKTALEAGIIDTAAFDKGIRGLVSDRRGGRRFLLQFF